jgi:hypothetical protein
MKESMNEGSFITGCPPSRPGRVPPIRMMPFKAFFSAADRLLTNFMVWLHPYECPTI